MVEFFHRYGDKFVTFFDQIGLNWPAPTWHTLFWLNVPIALIALAFTLWALRDVPQQRAKGRFDFLGTGLIIAALVALNVGLGANVEVSTSTTFETMSELPDYALPMVLLSVALLVAFIWVERRVRDPLINLKMFRQRNISAGLMTNLLIGYCLFIGLVTVPILVNVRTADTDQLQIAAREVGLLLSALTIPMAVAATPGGWLADRIGYRRTTTIGLVLAVVGFLLIWQTWFLEIQDWIIVGEMMLVGIGLGLTFSPISAAVINAADDASRGVASALVVIVRLVGMTLSVSSLTSLSLHRVTSLAAVELGSGVADPYVYADTYAHITVQVLAEMGLLGAVLCGVAVIPAYFLRQRHKQTPIDEVAIPTPGD
jgi:MFS family permease